MRRDDVGVADEDRDVRRRDLTPEEQATQLPPVFNFTDAQKRALPTWVTAAGSMDVAKIYLAELPLRSHVPVAFRGRWAAANAKVAKWHRDASEGSKKQQSALKLKIVLHVLLLRKSLRSSRGRGRRHDTIYQNFLDFEQGNFATLIHAALADVARWASRQRDSNGRRRAPVSLGDRMNNIILSQKTISRAARLLGGVILASGDDPDVAAQVIAKHPHRRKDVPTVVPNGVECEPVAVELAERYLSLDPASAVGPGGYRNTFLTSLALGESNEGVLAHEYFANRFLNGKCPPWYYRMKAAIRIACLTDLFDEHGNVRPVGITCCEKRSWTSALVAAKKIELAQFLCPWQTAVGVSGGCHLVPIALGIHLKLHPDHVALALDVKNAFNAGERAKILERIAAKEETRWLLPVMRAILQARSEVFGVAGLEEVANGLTQGEGTSLPAFAITIQEPLERAGQCLEEANGLGVSFADDIFFRRHLQLFYGRYRS